MRSFDCSRRCRYGSGVVSASSSSSLLSWWLLLVVTSGMAHSITVVVAFHPSWVKWGERRNVHRWVVEPSGTHHGRSSSCTSLWYYHHHRRHHHEQQQQQHFRNGGFVFIPSILSSLSPSSSSSSSRQFSPLPLHLPPESSFRDVRFPTTTTTPPSHPKTKKVFGLPRSTPLPLSSTDKNVARDNDQSYGTNNNDDIFVRKDYDDDFDIRTTMSLVGGQSLLIGGAVILASFTGTPNGGLGPSISFDWGSLQMGALLTVPLGVFAFLLELIEKRFQALQDVSRATQRSVLALLGGTLKPGLALVVSILLGVAAGFGEEMLFRGILQYELVDKLGSSVPAIICSSILFGLLHAVTPLYAVLATVASFYFGIIYLITDNLAIPIACHTLYDVVALMVAHWTVTKLTASERRAIMEWPGPQ